MKEGDDYCCCFVCNKNTIYANNFVITFTDKVITFKCLSTNYLCMHKILTLFTNIHPVYVCMHDNNGWIIIFGIMKYFKSFPYLHDAFINPLL